MRVLSMIMALAKYAHTRLADIGCRVLSFQGEDMAPKTKTRANTEPTHIVTVDDIDEALLHTSLVLPRDDNWRRWADALLDQRNRLARSGPARETRVLYPAEYRDEPHT